MGKLLKINSSLRIVIPGPIKRDGDGISIKHLIGTGIAIDQWEYAKAPKNVNTLYAWYLYISYLTSQFEMLMEDYNVAGSTRISYGTLDRNLASNNVIMIWGANSANVEGVNGEPIVGDGQAKAMQTYGPGVFGIISTPSTGPPRLLSDQKTPQNKLTSVKEKYLKYKLKYHHLKKMLINN